MPGEHVNVFAPLAQRRQTQTDDVQAVEQVLAEHAFFHTLFQVLVCGRNHAYIGFDRAVAAHPVKMPVGQHPQQTGLQIKRHVTNFVQEQRAAIGLLEPAPAHGLCTGERATLVAKQLTFKQIFGDSCGIDSNKWPIRAR